MARQVIDRLFAAPPVVVDAGIDDQPRRAPHLIGKPTELLVGRAVDAHLLAEMFDIEPPALAETGEIGLPAEPRSFLLFERDRALETVPGRAFVQRQRGDVIERARRQVVGIHLARIEPAASRGVEGRDCGIDRADREPVAGQETEVIGQFPVDALGDIG